MRGDFVRTYGSRMAARDHFVDDTGGALNAAGLPPLPSRVFSALLVDDDGRMTAAELDALARAIDDIGPAAHAHLRLA